MQKLLEAVKGSAWARLGLLALVIAIPTWMFGFTSHERSTIGLDMVGLADDVGFRGYSGSRIPGASGLSL
jgi:hypothetical protein